MNNGCNACEKPIKKKFELDAGFCLDCQLALADIDVDRAMQERERLEELKQQIRKEQDVRTDKTDVG
jgi:hypothetical protein